MVDPFKDCSYDHTEITEMDKKMIRKWKYQIKLARENFPVDEAPPEFSENKVSFFKSFVPPEKYKKILDVGCGWGAEIVCLKNAGYEEVVGVTLGHLNVKQAKEVFGETIYEMDMHNMDFPNDYFDAIFCSQTYEHALSPHLAAVEFWRVLKFGGICHIEVPYPDAGEETNKIRDYVCHYGNLYHDLIRSIFTRIGFKDLRPPPLTEAKYTFFFEKTNENKHGKLWSEGV